MATIVQTSKIKATQSSPPSSSATTNTIQTINAGFRYGNRWIFQDAQISIAPATITNLLGANGAGKSTLLRMLAGIAEPTQGIVTRTGGIGFVPQATAGVFPYTVFDMVLMGRARKLGIFSQPGQDDCRVASSALERVGMSHLANRPYLRLSGGQQQLVLIARALATQCDTLILDEPVSALDLHNQALVLQLLTELKDEGMAVVLSTHSPEHALHLGGQALVLDSDGSVHTGPTQDLLNNAVLSDLYHIDLFRHSIPDGGRDRKVVVTRYESVQSQEMDS